MKMLRGLVLALVPSRASLFDELWREFDLHYSYFELKHVDWAALGAQYRPLAIASADDAAFAAVLEHMLAGLQDLHVSISPAGVIAPHLLSRADTASVYYSPTLVFRKYVPTGQYAPGGHIRYGMTTSGAGYVAISDFGGANWETDMDIALAQLSQASSIVVDVRSNGGGTYALAAALAGRFADRAHTFGYVRRRNGPSHSDFTDYAAEIVEPAGPVQFHGPVIVLSNRRSYSTAENFVLAMRTLPSVTVVSDTTGGASGAPIVRELSNGWTYQLSEWIEYTPDRRPYEGVGLAPDIVVRATASDMT